MKVLPASLAVALILVAWGDAVAAEPGPARLDYEIKLETLLRAPSEKVSWFQPRPGVVPGAGQNGAPAVVMTIQQMLGSDYFTGLSVLRTDDLGRTWTKPESIPQLAWQDAGKGMKIGVCDFTWNWHAPTGKLLGIGHTVYYTSRGFAGADKQRDTVYSVFDPKAGAFTPWAVLEFFKDSGGKYFHNGTHGQWLVEPDGTLLVPVYFRPKSESKVMTGVVLRCTFDGAKLAIAAMGKEMFHPVPRGLYEKSITWYDGRYYMTIRNDKKGFVATSEDGLSFGPIRPWTFDDGSELGSYNTQQKWVTHSSGLFLVYTRRGANNDHIPRHRAPLFIGQVDPERLCVLRATERIAVPERGRALGNFDATTISAEETWITVAGGDAYCARLLWSKPNELVGRVK